jgi:HSP20 family protein
MLTHFTPFNRMLPQMDEWRRRMDRLFSEADTPPFLPAGTLEDPWSLSEATWPRANMYDSGTGLVLLAEVPGMTPENLQIQVQNDVLTLTGERRAQVPEGHTAHRRERPSLAFTRVFTLPTKIDADKINATIKDGILSLEMPKVPEAQPRQIAIRGSA